MAVEVLAPKAEILINNKPIALDLPSPGASVEQIRAFNQVKHPQLLNAAYELKQDGDQKIIQFKPYVGTKG